MSLSPVIDLFENTYRGISSIRAYRLTSVFKSKFLGHLNVSQKSMYWESVSNIWCSVRLQIVAVIIVSSIIVLSCVAHQLDILHRVDWITPLTIGLTLSYSLSLANSVSNVCRTLAETEREFVSLERVLEYEMGSLAEKGYLEVQNNHTHDSVDRNFESFTGVGFGQTPIPTGFLVHRNGCQIEVKNLAVSYRQDI